MRRRAGLSMTEERLTIRRGRPDDADLVVGFLRHLAAHDGEADTCRMTAADVRRWGFSVESRFEILIASLAEVPAGMVLFYPIFSTWDAKPSLFVNDIYVTDAARGKGIGRRLLAEVAALALERGCGRVEWHVLHEAAAITFYEAMGARRADEFRTYRLVGDPLTQLARCVGERRVSGHSDGD
jgi:GNAT superfamily N-acetyltransferase